MKALLIAMFTLFGMGTLLAQEAQPPKNLSPEACYAHFEKHTPKDLVEFVEAAVTDLAKNGEKALDNYNSINEKSWPEFPLHPLITVFRCDEMRALTFPIEEMRAAAVQEGFFKKFIDADGQYTFAQACGKLRGAKQAVWVTQNHFWLQCEGALRMGVLFMKVPGHPWVVQASLPNRKYSLEEMERALR